MLSTCGRGPGTPAGGSGTSTCHPDSRRWVRDLHVPIRTPMSLPLPLANLVLLPPVGHAELPQRDVPPLTPVRLLAWLPCAPSALTCSKPPRLPSAVSCCPHRAQHPRPA